MAARNRPPPGFVYFDVEQVPERLLDFASRVDARLLDYGDRVYSLDIGIGQSGKIWIYELNTMPGVVWGAFSNDKIRYHRMHQMLANWMHATLYPSGMPDPVTLSDSERVEPRI